jgi:hypothetical protein
VGSNFFYEQPVMFQIDDIPCIWFDRDEDGYILLSFKMPTFSGQPRAQIERNFWSVSPAIEELICPPSGRLIEVTYSNGDKFRAEFFDADSPDVLDEKYPARGRRLWYDRVRFPVTVVELWETAAGSMIEFGPKFSRMGNNEIVGAFSARNGTAGIQLNVSPAELLRIFPPPASLRRPT